MLGLANRVKGESDAILAKSEATAHGMRLVSEAMTVKAVLRQRVSNLESNILMHSLNRRKRRIQCSFQATVPTNIFHGPGIEGVSANPPPRELKRQAMFQKLDASAERCHRKQILVLVQRPKTKPCAVLKRLFFFSVMGVSVRTPVVQEC